MEAAGARTGAALRSRKPPGSWPSGIDAYTKDNTRAALFELAMNELARRTWDELTESSGRRVATPRTAILATLLADPASAWWDDLSTPNVVELRDDILSASLAAALTAARDAYGPESEDGWLWSRVGRANVVHFLGISAFLGPGSPDSRRARGR